MLQADTETLERNLKSVTHIPIEIETRSQPMLSKRQKQEKHYYNLNFNTHHTQVIQKQLHNISKARAPRIKSQSQLKNTRRSKYSIGDRQWKIYKIYKIYK